MPLLTVDHPATLPKATYNEETGRTTCTRKIRAPLPLKRLPISYSFGVFDGYDARLARLGFWSEADIGDYYLPPSLTEELSLRILPRSRSRCWIRLYRLCLMRVVPCYLQINLASLIRTRCLHVLLRQKSATKRVGVKYIRFEKELVRVVEGGHWAGPD